MKSRIILFLFYFVLLTKCDETKFSERSTDPEINMNTLEVIRWNGYPYENHEVTTEDGYILALHRIPYGLNQTAGNRPVVFLQHGLLDSSFTWVCDTPDKSLGFVLADNGYDVWLANSRGNVYSKKHIRYSIKSNKFWDFSWDEMAKYDIPASIEYILNITKSEKLSYIGHSQGSTIAFAKFGELSHLNSKISSMVAFAPVVFLGHVKSGIKFLAYVDHGIHIFYKIFSHGEFLPTNLFKKLLAEYVCGQQYASMICSNIMFMLAGYDTSNFNYTRLPVYLAHNPAGTSSKNMVHFAQAYKSNEFKMYDHGIFGNLYHYHALKPPTYTPNTHGIPVAMFWGGNDWLAVDVDVKRAIKELGDNVKFKKLIPNYNHMDFIWGADATQVVYQDTINFISKYK